MIGVLVILTLIGAIPASLIAAVLWLRTARDAAAASRTRLIGRASAWTAVAIGLQGISLLATLLLAISG